MSPSLLRIRTLAHDTGRWFIRLVLGSLLLAIGLAGISYAAARWYFWPRLDDIASSRIAQIEQRIGAPVAWGAIATDWQGLRPSIEIRDLSIGTGDAAIRIERTSATLSLAALVSGSPGVHDLRMDRPVLPLARTLEGVRIAALPASSALPATSGSSGSSGESPGQVASGQPATAQGPGSADLAAALGAVPDLRIGDGTVILIDPDRAGNDQRFDRVDLVLKSRGRLHDFRLDIRSAPGIAQGIQVEGDLLRPRAPDDADWRRWEVRGRIRATGLRAAPVMAEALRIRPTLLDAVPGVTISGLDGTIDPDITIGLSDGRFKTGRVALTGSDLRVPLPAPHDTAAGTEPGSTLLALSTLALDLRWQQLDDGRLQLRLPTLLAQGAGGFSIRARQAASVWTMAAARTGASSGASSGAQEGAQAGTPAATQAGTQGVATGGVLRLEHAELGPLHALARRFTPALDRIALISGRATALALDWGGGGGGGDGDWRLATDFERLTLAFKPTEDEVRHPEKLRLPGVAQVAGRVEATASGGRLQLRGPSGARAATSVAPSTSAPALPSKSPPASATATATARSTASSGTAAGGGKIATLTFGGALQEPEVPLTELEAAIQWRRRLVDGVGLIDVDFDDVRFANADLAGRLQARFVDAVGKPGALELNATIDRGAVRRVWRYLPRRLSPEVRDWVRGAFESGRIEQMTVDMKGPLEHFPYRGAEASSGDFRLAARVKDALISFAPGWPALHRADGEFAIERASLRFSIAKAEAPGATVGPVKGAIDDLREATLRLDGEARGDADAFVRYVNASPLVAGLGEVTRPMKAQGPTELNLSLALPLGPEPRTQAAGKRTGPVVKGRLNFEGTDIAFVDGVPPLRGIRGALDFHGDGLRFAGVHAQLLGEAVQIDGETLENGETRVSIAGTLSAKGLRELSVDPVTQGLAGTSAFKASVGFARTGMRMTLESDLVGIESRLPEPLTKPAGAAWPLHLSVTPVTTLSDRIEMTLARAPDAELRLIAQRERANERRPLQITRAAIASQRAPALPPQGLAIQYVGKRLDVDAWRAVFDAPKAAVSARPTVESDGLFAPGFSPVPTEVTLRANEMRIFDRDLNAVELSARRAAERWSAKVKARELAGVFDWNEGVLDNREGRLTARFGRLEIPKSQRDAVASLLKDGARSSDGPRTLPALDVTADTLILGGATLGRLELLATNRDGAWRLDTLRLGSPAARFEATGGWREQTDLDFRLSIVNAGELLEQFGLAGVVRNGVGELSGKLAWKGSPLEFDPASLSGGIELAVKEGQFLKVEPGAAKLIGVLNLQALPKLMTLDFRDLFAQGFSFDELRGKAAIANGVARTDSLAMRGLQAVVEIRGQADLARATQHLTVTVLPELNGGLASLAYAAIINPAVGLGAFLAQSILSPSLSKALAYEIDIKGSWADPEVVQRKRERIGPPQQQ